MVYARGEPNRHHSTYKIPYASLLLVVTRGCVHCGTGEDMVLGILEKLLTAHSCAMVYFLSKTGQPYKRGPEGP